MTSTYLAVALVGALIGVSSAQYSRVRAAPASFAPSYAQPQFSSCGCEDLSALVQLANLIGTPNTPQSQPKSDGGSLNSGNIIDKLIDALILTATANKNKQTTQQQSGNLIDISLLQGLLNQQRQASTPTASPAASTAATATSTAASPTSALGGLGSVLSPVTGLVDGLL